MSIQRRRHIELLAITAAVSFTLGVATTAVLNWRFGARDPVISPAEVHPHIESQRAEATGTLAPPPDPIPVAPDTTSPSANAGAVADLKARALTLPVAGVTPSELRDTFDEVRGGNRRHEAMDILAPRNTAVFAVEDGTIAKLFLSKAGGITIYQFDPSQRFAYYYAHLERYASGLHETQSVRRGQAIGYVGTSGNAPKDTPHLHFAIFELTPDKHWWEGAAIDPFHVFRP